MWSPGNQVVSFTRQVSVLRHIKRRIRCRSSLPPLQAPGFPNSSKQSYLPLIQEYLAFSSLKSAHATKEKTTRYSDLTDEGSTRIRRAIINHPVKNSTAVSTALGLQQGPLKRFLSHDIAVIEISQSKPALSTVPVLLNTGPALTPLILGPKRSAPTTHPLGCTNQRSPAQAVAPPVTPRTAEEKDYPIPASSPLGGSSSTPMRLPFDRIYSEPNPCRRPSLRVCHFVSGHRAVSCALTARCRWPVIPDSHLSHPCLPRLPIGSV